jgi:hypothetical protein
MDAMIRLPGASTGIPGGAPGDSSQVDEKGAASLFTVPNIIESSPGSRALISAMMLSVQECPVLVITSNANSIETSAV